MHYIDGLSPCGAIAPTLGNTNLVILPMGFQPPFNRPQRVKAPLCVSTRYKRLKSKRQKCVQVKI